MKCKRASLIGGAKYKYFVLNAEDIKEKVWYIHILQDNAEDVMGRYGLWRAIRRYGGFMAEHCKDPQQYIVSFVTRTRENQKQIAKSLESAHINFAMDVEPSYLC